MHYILTASCLWTTTPGCHPPTVQSYAGCLYAENQLMLSDARAASAAATRCARPRPLAPRRSLDATGLLARPSDGSVAGSWPVLLRLVLKQTLMTRQRLAFSLPAPGKNLIAGVLSTMMRNSVRSTRYDLSEVSRRAPCNMFVEREFRGASGRGLAQRVGAAALATCSGPALLSITRFSRWMFAPTRVSVFEPPLR
jgi:hypothetical protein